MAECTAVVRGVCTRYGEVLYVADQLRSGNSHLACSFYQISADSLLSCMAVVPALHEAGQQTSQQLSCGGHLS